MPNEPNPPCPDPVPPSEPDVQALAVDEEEHLDKAPVAPLTEFEDTKGG